jgi:hypothetical protein
MCCESAAASDLVPPEPLADAMTEATSKSFSP